MAKNKYSEEQKINALVKADEIGLSKAASLLSISISSISDWKKNEELALKAENIILKKENSQLKTENEKLIAENKRKASEFFRLQVEKESPNIDYHTKEYLVRIYKLLMDYNPKDLKKRENQHFFLPRKCHRIVDKIEYESTFLYEFLESKLSHDEDNEELISDLNYVILIRDSIKNNWFEKFAKKVGVKTIIYEITTLELYYNAPVIGFQSVLPEIFSKKISEIFRSKSE